MLWRLVNSEQTRSYDGGEAVMLFNPVSWATHRVAPMVHWVVEQLRQEAQTQAQLFEELRLNGEDPSALQIHLTAALAELERYGIIERDLPRADA